MPFHPPRYLPDPGIKPESPALEADSLPRKPLILYGFPGSSAGKESPTVQETWVRSLGWDDPLEKGKATHSSILAWSSPWGHKEVDTTEQLSLHFTFVYIFSWL